MEPTEKMKKKAYTCRDHPLGDFWLLVFASTSNKAKSLALATFRSYTMDTEYTGIRVYRNPEYDVYSELSPCVIESNEDLPESAPDFYLDRYN